MSKNTVRTTIIGKSGFQIGGEVSKGASCVYCGSPTVLHTWCKACLNTILMCRRLAEKQREDAL